MKPIKIKIKGFNSFIEEQTIDFEKLSDKGIFGIFGPTGSGKSSIIDAMTFALYGKVARYNSEEKRALINSNTNSAAVTFIFSLNIGEKVVFYEVSREIKYGKTGNFTHNARLVKNIGDDLEVIAQNSKVSKEIVNIMGLNYDDFTRSVVLPQGKFSEFLMLENKDRRKMLERIFGFEKYGTALNDAINERKKIQSNIVSEINSKLEEYSDVSENKVELLNDELKQKEILAEKNKKELSENRKLLEKYKVYINLKNEFDKYKIKESNLNEQKYEIKEKEEKLAAAKRAEKVYHFYIAYNKNKKDFDDACKKNSKNEKLLEKSIGVFSNAKQVYENFLNDKKVNYTKIIEKEIELNRGLELKKDIEKIENERSSLLKDYEEIKKSLDEKECVLEKEEAIKKNADKKIAEIIAKKEKNIIYPEYRKNIETALNTERKFIEISNKYTSELNKKSIIQKNIDDYKKERVNLENEILDFEKKLSDIKTKKSDIFEKNIYTASEIIEMQKKNEEIKRVFIDKKECFEKFISNKKELDDFEKQKFSINEKIKELEKLEKEKNNSLQKLNEKIKLLENKEFILELALNLQENSPCPVCGSIHHPSPAKKVSDGILEKLINDKQLIENELKTIAFEKNELTNKIAIVLSKIDELSKLIENNKEISEFDIDKEKSFVETKNGEFEKAKKIFDDFQNISKECDEQERKINAALNDLKVKFAEINSCLKKDNEKFEELENLIKQLSDEKENFSKTLDVFKNNLNIDDFEKEYTRIIEVEKEKNILEKEEKNNRIILEEKLTVIENLKKEIAELTKKMESIISVGKEKKSFITKNIEELEKITDKRNIFEYIEEIADKKKYYDENEVILKEKYNLAELEKNNILESKIKSEKEKEAFEKLKFNSYESLNKAVYDNGFNNVSEFENAFMEKEIILKLEKELSDFYDNMKDITANLNNIKLKLEKENISCKESDIEEKELLIESLNKKIEINYSDIGQIKTKIEDIKNRLIKMKSLKKEFEVQNHKLDLITELSNTMKGNRFIEYISKRKLYYVTLAASERLSKITNGRYAVELDGDNENESANFIIRDNFNGGARRATRSLSGGEIFLTSLSLAIALSEEIQLKNSAPLETFFLDEGFGTLDNSFLDIVMDSLEKLYLENIKVGIITHVEEIKNRIQSRVLVIPANETDGTKIKIE